MVLLSIDWTNLHELLRSLYDEMMPLCEDMASVAKGVAGIGALFYVAYRVWQSLSRAEEIDVFPLFRPFVLGLCIMFFPTMVLGTINGILSPVCSATSSLVEQQTFDMKKYQEEKDELEREAMLRDPAKAFLVSDEEFDKKIDELGWSLGDMDTMINMYGQKAVYDMGEKVRQWFRELLELFFQAASLLIDTLRTFFLIVLSILGPISFALAVYDGFQSTLTTWLSRYICIYLWLPVGDLFGAILSRIQVLMLQQDIKQMQDPTFIPDASNSVYCIFMIIGIIGYFCVPTVSSWIIQAGGAGAYGQKANGAGKMAGNGAAAVGGAVAQDLVDAVEGGEPAARRPLVGIVGIDHAVLRADIEKVGQRRVGGDGGQRLVEEQLVGVEGRRILAVAGHDRDQEDRAALAEGKLSQTRYDSYCAMYEEVKDVKDWQRRGM